MRARLLLVLLACAAAEWVEISQSHYRKPLKTAHLTPSTLQQPTSKAPERPTSRNHTNNWGKGHVYRADLDHGKPLNTKTNTAKVNPFLTHPSNSKKPNRIEIRRTTPKLNENEEKEGHISKPHRNKHTTSAPALVQRHTNKTPNRVVFLDRDKGVSVIHSSEERTRLKSKGKVEPVKKPEQSASEESVENTSRADILTTSEEYGSSTGSSEERIRHKTKGKVESVEKPDDIRPLKKNNPGRPKPVLKGSDKKITIVNVNPTENSNEQYADSIGNVKLVFQKPTDSNVKRVPYHNNMQRKKPNRIYVNKWRNTNQAAADDRVSNSSKPQSDDSASLSTESQYSEIEETSTKRIRQPDKNPKEHYENITERPQIPNSSEIPVSVDPSIAQTNDEITIEHYKEDIKRLDVGTLNDFKDPEFVTKYETFEIEDNEDKKYADVTVETEPGDSQETVGGTSEVSEPTSIEEPCSTVAQDSIDKLDVPEATTPIPNVTKPNPMENLVKLMKVVAETISKNTKNSFISKINYLERLRDTIMSNIKARIDAEWPDDDAPAQGTRRARQARGHVEFPSSEGALMTISFLTFAVFLIKLVLQVISTYNHKVSPAVFAISRAASALRRPKNNH